MLGPLRRWLGRLIVPRSLFWRSLLIVIVPLLILQILLTYIFYNRHWDTVTRWLAFGVASEGSPACRDDRGSTHRRRPRRLHRAGAPQHRPQHHPDTRRQPRRGRGGRGHPDRGRPHRYQDPGILRGAPALPVRRRLGDRQPGACGGIRADRARPAAGHRRAQAGHQHHHLAPLGLDGGQLDRPLGDLDLLPAPAGPADPPARPRRRQLRQGPRRRRLPPAGGPGDPPGRPPST